MNATSLLFGEHSLSKVAAAYDDFATASAAAQQVVRLPDIQRRQVQLVEPYDSAWGRKVEPETTGIWRTVLRAHATCGVVGVVAGSMLFAVLYVSGVAPVVDAPAVALVAMMMIGAMLGLMVGGLVTMRPDHEAVIRPVREAADAGRWTVVVHPETSQQFDLAVRQLRQTGATVVTTW